MDLVGKVLGKYKIVEKGGSGGMADVYKGLQVGLEREVAIKVLPPVYAKDLDRLKRFRRESQATAKLSHPNIITIYDSGEQDGYYYYVMEYLKAESLETIIKRDCKLSLKQAIKIAKDVLKALIYTHDKSIIHRDLKPGNILVDVHGRVKVIDFGVARVTDTDLGLTTKLTETGQLLGTIQYMSPEQCGEHPEDLDTRSDVYTLGVVLYELLCGKPPYEVRDSSVIGAARRIVEEPPQRPSAVVRSLRGDLENILLKALEKDRERRYQSVAELAEDLRRHLEGRVVLARPAGPLYRTWKWMKRNPGTGTAIVMGLATVLLFAGYVLFVSYPQLRKERDLAKEGKKRALAAELAAREQARIADARYEEIVRLADVKRLADLEKEANRLWPAAPDTVPALEAWVRRAEALLARLPDHRRSLAEIRSRAVRKEHDPGTGADTWIFENTETGWQHELLSGLVSGLEALGMSESGLLAEVRDRLAFASTVRKRSIEDPAEAWKKAVASIEDPARCPAYKGLVITPQMGVVPLGRDPDSGLWEFAHLKTGEVPERGADGKLRITKNSGLVFVLIPGGSFSMGAVPASEDAPPGTPNVDPNAYPDEGPVHTVTVPPFFLSKYEMTQGQWLRFTTTNPSLYRAGSKVPGHSISLLHPVEQVNWEEARSVLFRLGLRLPSEAEWEYAARAGTSTIWWTGNEVKSLAGAANLCDRFAKENGIPSTWKYEADLDDGYLVHAPVGSFLPNAFGLHDVCGNVYEWCSDAFAHYDRTPSDGSAMETPNPRTRILRGGSHLDVAVDGRSSARSHVPPIFRANNVGLRPARDLEGR